MKKIDPERAAVKSGKRERMKVLTAELMSKRIKKAAATAKVLKQFDELFPSVRKP